LPTSGRSVAGARMDPPQLRDEAHFRDLEAQPRAGCEFDALLGVAKLPTLGQLEMASGDEALEVVSSMLGHRNAGAGGVGAMAAWRWRSVARSAL